MARASVCDVPCRSLENNRLASSNVTDLDRRYKDASNADYRLKATSLMIDAGSNPGAGGGEDLAGNVRIIDGKGDELATVDIGAYEYDPNAPYPAFKTAKAAYHLYSGVTVDVPVSIDPPAGGAVQAAVDYSDPTDVSGALAFPDGAGPVNLAITTAGTLANPGAAVTVAISESATSLGVDSGEFEVTVHNRLVTIAGSARVYA